ncbi:hypothetical protein [Granulicoccus sp. GXG6511]|uniref:hypothetical protein n=1 Tax=Granulicoccus sp. GXG6511 TaxID=3381351 RepID=UPI003D7DE34B
MRWIPIKQKTATRSATWAETTSPAWADEPTKLQTAATPEAGVLDDTTELTPVAEAAPVRAREGLLLRGRYRLEELLVQRPDTQTWRAIDVLLARPVRVHLLPADQPNDALLAAAKRAAVATDFRVLRVLDATIPADPGVVDESWLGPFIVCEYAPGQSLEDLLAGGTLSTLEAAWLVREVADALSGMHARGLHHQRLSPATVVVTTAGHVKIVGFLVEAELVPGHETLRDPEAADVLALGRLLYAALVGRWPGGSWHGLPAAPTDSAGQIRPLRDVQASVPPSLDQICDRILSPSPRDGATRLRTAAEVSAALSRVLGTADAAEDLEQRVRISVAANADPTLVNRIPQSYAPTAHLKPAHVDAWNAEQTANTPVPRTQSTRPRRAVPWRRILAAVVVLAVIGVLTAVGLRLSHWAAPGAPAGTAATGPATQWPVVAAHDFDPEGNGEEHPNQVSLAFDGDPATSWTTMNYFEAEIGNKTGVGLVFDLGEVRDLSRVELDLDAAGTTVEVRVPAAGADGAATSPPGSTGEWRAVGTAERTPMATTISLVEPVETRYVLIFFTELPAVGSAFTGGIAEARFWS